MSDAQGDERTYERLAEPKAPNPTLCTFKPGLRQVILGRIADALQLKGIEELPVYFLQEVLIPAKVGLRGDLMNRYDALGHPILRKKLRAALSGYFRSFQYQQALIQGQLRFDLDLRQAGTVTPSERMMAMNLLNEIKKSHLNARARLRDSDRSSSQQV